MPTVEILNWKENFEGGTAWLVRHAKAELEKRLRRGIKASPKEVRRLAKEIHARQILCLRDVLEEGLFDLTQILQAMGAEIRVSLEDGNSRQLFKRVPRH